MLVGYAQRSIALERQQSVEKGEAVHPRHNRLARVLTEPLHRPRGDATKSGYAMLVVAFRQLRSTIVGLPPDCRG